MVFIWGVAFVNPGKENGNETALASKEQEVKS